MVRWWTNIRYGHTGLKKIARHCRNDSRVPKTQLTHVRMKIFNFSHFSWAIFKKSCFFCFLAYFHSAKPLFSKFMVFLWVFLWKLKSPYIGLVRDERKGFNRFSVFPIVRTQGIRSYWTELLSWAELLNWAENVIFDILEPLLFENIVHVLYYLNFVFVFVFVFVVSGWTPVLSSFRRCMKCWLECWNRGNTEVLLIIGLMAGEEGEEKQE